MGIMRRVCRSDKKLGRHAARICTQRATEGVVNQESARAIATRAPLGSEAGSAGPDDGDIGVMMRHHFAS